MGYIYFRFLTTEVIRVIRFDDFKEIFADGFMKFLIPLNMYAAKIAEW